MKKRVKIIIGIALMSLFALGTYLTIIPQTEKAELKTHAQELTIDMDETISVLP